MNPLSKKDLAAVAAALDSAPLRPGRILMNARDAAEILGERCEVCLCYYMDLKTHTHEECNEAIVGTVMEI